jgi:hypothetical protein
MVWFSGEETMNVAVLSFFRNAAHGQVQRFMRQAAALRDALHRTNHRMRIIAVYGDCIDNTKDALIDAALQHQFALTLVEFNHGGPVFGSTEHPDRLRVMSTVGNAGLEAVLPQDDAVFYVESDLVWSPETVLALLERLGNGVDLVAPMVFAGTDGNNRPVFYDLFVFRKDGHRFGPFYPYHNELNLEGLTKVDSVGSGFVMRGEVGLSCRIRNQNVLLGFCEDVWSHGWNVNVDATQSIYHP